MDVSELMTRHPVTIEAHATLEEAMQLMDDHDVRHLPVLEDDALVGVVSDRDLLEVLGWMPARRRKARERVPGEPAPRVVGDLMHTALSVVAPEDTVVTAAVEMVLLGIGCLPVVQKDRLLGIVTEMDLLGAYWRTCRAGRLRGDVDPPVAEHMTAGVRSVIPEASIRDAAELARSLSVRHLPVVHGERVVGMVSDRDLRAAAGSGQLETGSVQQIMATDPVTIGPRDRLSRAAQLMLEHRFSALPVVDGGRLVGILSLRDVLDHCMNTLREPERFTLG